jgi:hypothetical protein
MVESLAGHLRRNEVLEGKCGRIRGEAGERLLSIISQQVPSFLLSYILSAWCSSLLAFLRSSSSYNHRVDLVFTTIKMHFSQQIAVVAAFAACVSGHGVVTKITGANGVTMPGLTIQDGTPRDCTSKSVHSISTLIIC